MMEPKIFSQGMH